MDCVDAAFDLHGELALERRIRRRLYLDQAGHPRPELAADRKHFLLASIASARIRVGGLAQHDFALHRRI
jgi:hypothetical protein